MLNFMHENESSLVWYPGHELLLHDIVRAENCHLYDSSGTRYVDLESGVWCTSIGHGNPRIKQVMEEQYSQYGHSGFNYSGGVVEEAADGIMALTGCEGGHCVFLCSGSEAVEYGVRLAEAVLDKPLMMTMADSYFGAYGSAARREERGWFLFDWFPCVDCPFEGDCADSCEHWASIPFDRIGGFLLEPGSSSGLVRFPPDKIVRCIAAAIHNSGGLVLVNEVTTGIGRTGKWFGFQHYGISPDIVAIGKGVGNGYPVSATAFAPGVVERLGSEPMKYAQSHQNDPVGAAVAREVIRIIDEQDLIARGMEIAGVLMAGLLKIKERSGRISEIRGRGPMIGIDLEDGPDVPFTIAAHRELVKRGYIPGRRPGVNVIRLDPALTIDREDIDGFLAAFGEVMEAG
jgi:acetylornithine/N-succinyldiaminopimelate aminotransferase